MDMSTTSGKVERVLKFSSFMTLLSQPTQSLSESYVTEWLDVADRLTFLGNFHYRRAVVQGIGALHSNNENNDPWGERLD